MRNAFVFDPGKCTGCQACRLACTIENDLAPDHSYRQVMTYNERRHPAAPLWHLSLACNHCAEPACLAACPSRAYEQDPSTGAVLLDEKKCIGCKYCTWACPFDAPRFDELRGVMTKCTFCQERLLAGGEPACAELCPTGALGYARLPEAELSTQGAGLPATGLAPALRLVPLEPAREMPEMPAPPPRNPFVPWGAGVPVRISLRSEWALALFSLLAAVLVGLSSSLLGDTVRVGPVIFGGLAVAGLVISASHLGRKSRAWRGALNLRSSWLSREVVGYGLFVVLATTALLTAPVAQGLAVAVLALGLLALLAVDCVYGCTTSAAATGWDSASVLATGLLLLACWLDSPWLAAGIALAKFVFYLRRFAVGKGRWRVLLAVLRVGGGLVLPAELWWRGLPPDSPWVLGAVLLGEIIDRGQFYSARLTVSPQAQMDQDLAVALGRDEPAG